MIVVVILGTNFMTTKTKVSLHSTVTMTTPILQPLHTTSLIWVPTVDAVTTAIQIYSRSKRCVFLASTPSKLDDANLRQTRCCLSLVFDCVKSWTTLFPETGQINTSGPAECC